MISKSEYIIERYANHGIKVLPVHEFNDGRCLCKRRNCKLAGKHPAVTNWPELATTDERQIREWWDKNPDWNVGILLGLTQK